MKPLSAAVLAVLAFASLAFACTPARPPSAPALAALSSDDIRAIVSELAEARQLAEKRPVRIALLPEDRFTAQVRALLDAEPTSDSSEQAGFLLGFNFLPRLGKGPALSSAADVLAEQIVGYYHREQDRVFIRKGPPSSPEDALMQRGVIAHEVHHALQAQHFEIPALDSLPHDDARLALLALVEGDAQVAMAAYLGSAYGAPIRRTIRRITDVIKDVPLEALARRAPQDHGKLMRALPLMRERLTFPYLEGMTFVADMYRAGGFELVNRIYADPPSTTSHILHPESYIAGSKPYELELPAPPAGHRPIARGRLGELQIRVRLSACVSRPEAVDAAAGWAGDSYLVTAAPSGKLALFWRTAWESDEDAAEFESAVRKNAGCWHENAVEEPGLALSVDSGLSGKRASTPMAQVALVRGLPAVEAEKALAAVLSAPQQRPAAEAIGDYRVPPREPLPQPQRGIIRGLVYRSDWLGIEARLPTGMRPVTDREHLELFINRPDVVVAGALALSDRVTTPKYNELAFHAMAQGFADAIGGGAVVPISHGSSPTPLGNGIERTWALYGTPLQMRMIMVPICAGNGSLVFLQAYADPYARQVLDGWLATFRWTTRNAPVCGYLNPP